MLAGGGNLNLPCSSIAGSIFNDIKQITVDNKPVSVDTLLKTTCSVQDNGSTMAINFLFGKINKKSENLLKFEKVVTIVQCHNGKLGTIGQGPSKKNCPEGSSKDPVTGFFIITPQ